MKKEIIEVLKNREFDKLIKIGNIKKTLSILISFLYDNELSMFRAAEAIGYICKSIYRENPELVKETIRRMFWYMNEENGGYCMGAPIVIGEIARVMGEDFEDFINLTASLIENSELETRYVVYSIGRIGKRILEAGLNLKDKLLKLLEDSNPITRAYTIKTIHELEIEEALPKLKKMLYDEAIVRIYDDGYFKEVKISELAAQAVRSLESRKKSPDLLDEFNHSRSRKPLQFFNRMYK